MMVSQCCGAATKVVHRPDHPYVFDDTYDLQIPVRVCTKCGKVLDPTAGEKNEA
ncbi:hypothetical protein [Brevibacillus sp. H7]|uniref:hypothetical protein n=1 Tax=Brevibacillus sp. H7 TaxID=3349138 RepID=UPI003805C497